jgi:hypothetical protein
VTAPQNDRYEPLPGFLSLPSFLYRKLGPRGRLAAKVGGGLLLVAVTVAVIVLAPRIAESNRERKTEERRAAAAALAARVERVKAEQRPHRGRADAGSPRGAVLAELRAAILADARAREAAGRLPRPAAKRVECEPLDGTEPGGQRVAYDCTAVTSDLPAIEGSPRGVIGHPFRAIVAFSAGRFTWCKVSGRAGEGALTSEGVIRLPRACSR